MELEQASRKNPPSTLPGSENKEMTPAQVRRLQKMQMVQSVKVEFPEAHTMNTPKEAHAKSGERSGKRASIAESPKSTKVKVETEKPTNGPIQVIYKDDQGSIVPVGIMNAGEGACLKEDVPEWSSSSVAEGTHSTFKWKPRSKAKAKAVKKEPGMIKRMGRPPMVKKEIFEKNIAQLMIKKEPGIAKRMGRPPKSMIKLEPTEDEKKDENETTTVNK